MTWAKFDDLYDDNRKIKRAWRRHPRAVGLHAMSVTYCARHETDGLVDADWLEEKMPRPAERRKTLAVLVDVGLFSVADDGHYMVKDYLAFNPSRADLERTREWDRKRKELFRDPELVAAIRKRDHDRCRYCGVKVNWKDRRGESGGTYDHVTPRGPNTLDNVVVACRRCNCTKSARTPEESGMPLLTPGLAQSQNGASSQARSGSSSVSDPDLHTRPVPSRPVTTPPTPPQEGEAEVFEVVIDDPDWLPPYLRLFRPQGPDAPPAEALFCLWRDLYEHHDSAFDDAKRKAIRDALATYPPERVARAIAGGMLDPHLRGENEDRRKYDGLGTLLRLGKRGKRNNVEHLSELFDEKEPRFKDEPWEVAMQNAVAHRAWQREAWAVLEEQELWLARHGRRLRVDASAKWQRFVDETGYDTAQLRAVA